MHPVLQRWFVLIQAWVQKFLIVALLVVSMVAKLVFARVDRTDSYEVEEMVAL